MSELELFDHQKIFLDDIGNLGDPARALLFYKTGAGKSLTAVLGMKALGWERTLVIAPPSTHAQWMAVGQAHDLQLEVMSHAKFRMRNTKISRAMPVIADEMHLFGGQTGQGWKKLDTLALHLRAPLFLLSATPQYNDAERCYCVVHILSPHAHKGGFLQFLYTHCQTEQNPFGMVPKVVGFQRYPDAASFLADQPYVYHLPDDLAYDIIDIPYRESVDSSLDLGYNSRDHKMVASIIEMTHTVRYQGLVEESGLLQKHVFRKVKQVVLANKPVLVYVNHASIAEALARTFDKHAMKYAIVTGDTPKLKKQAIIREFLSGQHSILIGTATLATGTDGMDKVCNTLLILDDTDDDALRRQLVGRIMPRGDFISIVDKQVIRLIPT